MKYFYSSLLIVCSTFSAMSQWAFPVDNNGGVVTYDKSRHIVKTTSEVSLEQMVKECVFFKGDTLNGFDLKANINEALKHADIYRELKVEVFNKEVEFVKSKYNIALLPFEISAKSKAINPLPVITASCNNVDFESGNFNGWTGAIGYNALSTNPLTIAGNGIYTNGLNASWKSCAYHTIVSAAGGNDYYGGFPVLHPGGGNYSVRLGGENANVYDGTDCNNLYSCSAPSGGQTNCGGETVEQTFLVDPLNSLFTFSYAAVLNDGGHSAGHQPYFSVQVYNSSGVAISCLSQRVELVTGVVPPGGVLSAQGNCWFSPGSTSYNVYYIPWKSNSFNLSAYAGTNVTVRFTAAGCTDGDHFCYAYFDGACGSAQITMSGGGSCSGSNAILTAPPTIADIYSWSGPGIVGSSTGQTITANAAGTYTVTVGTGICAYTLSVPVSFGTNGPTATASTSANVSCHGGNNGIASSNVSGGTGTYTYLWSNGATTQNASSLTAGTYSVTVKDANGCSSTSVATITEPIALGANALSVNVNCNGGNNGSAVANGTGGTAGYTYSWSTGATTQSISSLIAGTYTVVVTDSKGCSKATSTLVTQPTVLGSTVTSTMDTCGSSVGTATVNPLGGTGPYSYSWSTGATTQSISSLIAGTYTVVVTDSKGCSKATSTLVTQPTVLGSTVTSTMDTCGSSVGTATVNPLGGTGPYSYSWSTGVTTQKAVSLNAGSYSVIITDAKGCTKVDAAVIAGVPLLLNFQRDYYICGEAGGAVQLTASGGTSYNWSPGATLDDSTIASPLATPYVTTTYTVTVNNGSCSDTGLVTVHFVPSPMPPTINQLGDSLWIIQNYAHYQWYFNGTPLTGETNFYTIATQTGYYAVYVTDSLGCNVVSQSVYYVDVAGTFENMQEQGIKVYPNPATDELWVMGYDSWANNEMVNVELLNVLGEVVYSNQLSTQNSQPKTTLDVSSFAKGVYILQLYTEHKQYRVRVIKD